MKTEKKSQNSKDQNSVQPKPKESKKNVEEKKYSPEKLKILEQERQKRIKNEKLSERENQKIYEEILFEEKKKKKFTKKKEKNEDLNPLNSSLKISEKKAQNILEEGGMLDAYKYLIIQLCKNGLPTGNLFEYSAYVIKNYEKKWKEKKSKMKKENIEKYWEEKEKIIKETLEKNKKDKKLLNRSLDEIEMKKYIKNLDRSRSSRGVKPLREKINNDEDKNTTPSGIKKKNKSLNKNNNVNQDKKTNDNNSKNAIKKDKTGKK